MEQKIALSVLLVLGLAFALNTTSVVPARANVFDAKGGMGLGNNVVYDGTQYVNASDNVYANASGRDTEPTWAQANFSLPFPGGAKVTDAVLALEHQQSAAGEIRVNVSVNNGTGWSWNVCSFPPLSQALVDSWSYCNLTGYVSANVSLIQVYLNITYSAGTKVESMDLLQLNYTYIIFGNLSGTVAVSSPANGTVAEAGSQLNITGPYNVSCTGAQGAECGSTEAYAEYCAGGNCTNFQRITNATDVYSLSQNGVSCGYLYAGSNCSGTLNVSAAAKPGEYLVRISAYSPSNNIHSRANGISIFGSLLTGWAPPYSAVCYDPIGGQGVYGCTSHVNAQDLAYAQIKYNPTNQPGWANANFSFSLPEDAIIENVSMAVSHKEDNPSNQNGTAYFWNGTAWQWACSLGMGLADHGNECSLPLAYFSNAGSLANALLRYEFNTSLGTSTAFLDFLGMRAGYRMPVKAQLSGSVGMQSPPDRSTTGAGTDFNITGNYSLRCTGSPESECRATSVFAEFCFGEGCTDFRRVADDTEIYNLTINEASCGFLTGGQNCSGNFSVASRAYAGKYALRIRATSYGGDLFSNTSTVTFTGPALTPCTPVYSAACNSPSGSGIYNCTSEVNSLDYAYANLRYTPTNQPGWMATNSSFALPGNAYITNVSSRITHRIERSDRQTGTEFLWNGTAWQKACDLSMLTYDHSDTCGLPLNLFQSAASLSNILLKAEYYTSLGTSNALVDLMCMRASYRTPTLNLDKEDYILGDVLNLTGSDWVYGGLLDVSVYDNYGNLSKTGVVSTNGSGYFDYLLATENITAGNGEELFTANVTDVSAPWHAVSAAFRVRSCEAYVEEPGVPCSVQCPFYTNYTISLSSFEGDERITSGFKVCHR